MRGGGGEAARPAGMSLTDPEELKVLAVDKVPAVFKVMSDCKVTARSRAGVKVTFTATMSLPVSVSC